MSTFINYYLNRLHHKLFKKEFFSPLLIEIISICNVRCVWCTMQTFKKHKLGYMKLENFNYIINNNIDYIKKNDIIIEPYFRGEPLLHPNFWEICDILKNNSIPNGGINTNLSLNIEVEKFLEYQMSTILVNIGGTTKEIHEQVMRGSDFDLVCSNLRKLWKLGINARIKMNPIKLNIHQLCDLPRFVTSLGGKAEFIVPYTTCYPIPQTATQEELVFFFENVVSEDVNSHLRFTYDLSKADKGIKTKKSGCNFLMDIIFFDGQFSVCCHDQLQYLNVGNVFENTIDEIRSSKKYIDAVEKAKKCEYFICKECN